MSEVEDDIEVIESGYEFLLAYAAQGRPPQDETGPGPHPRPTLEDMVKSMGNLASALKDLDGDFEQVIVADVKRACAVVNFILSQPKIGSEIIDNLNASNHLRTVLTDLFVYSEALKPSDLSDTASTESGNGSGSEKDSSDKGFYPAQ